MHFATIAQALKRVNRWHVSGLLVTASLTSMLAILMAIVALRTLIAEFQAIIAMLPPEYLGGAGGARVMARIHSLDGRVVTGLIFVSVIAGPISVLILLNSARRLRLIAKAMARLTRREPADDVLAALRAIEAANTADEITEMVKAVEAFHQTSKSLRASRDEIEAVNMRFLVALENMGRGLSMFAADERLIVCNTVYQRMYDLPAHLVIPGTSLEDLLTWRARANPSGGGVPLIISRYRAANAVRKPLRYTRALPDGRFIDISIEPLTDGGWVTVHQDVTSERLAEARIAAMAKQDPLTSLANRRGLEEALTNASQSLATGGRAEGGKGYTLLCIDLDHFKTVNDTFGHPTGDALLVEVARLLRQETRTEDYCARTGGDEFTIVQTGVSRVSDAEALARRLVHALSQPLRAGEHTVQIGASIGVGTSLGGHKAAAQIMNEADAALYAAKSAGRNTFMIYDEEIEGPLRARRQLVADLRPALCSGQMTLMFQPIVSLRTGSVQSCEALLRWQHPVRGVISPAEFIPLAEQHGHIIELGRWVIGQACRAAASWPGETSVAVNLSALQVQDESLLETIACSLSRYGLPPSRFEIEITESALLADIDSIRARLARIKQLGVRIALDDFGTGYSSLSYLRAFPFDQLKIDQSFVRDITNRNDCVAIVKAVAQLARTLDMTTVAEGVETADHLHRVHLAGCTAVQGYLFSRPVAESEIPQLLAKWPRRSVA